jgi:hypothetical protein
MPINPHAEVHAMKKLIAILVGSLVIASSGSFAADSHHCNKGQHWDSKTSMCVKDAKKK